MKRRIRYMALWDVGQIQFWLEDYAACGWYLKKIRLGNFAVFRRGEPKQVRYRLEPILEEMESQRNYRIQSYEEFGWQYIGKFHNIYNVFLAESVTAPELHTEPKSMEMVLETQERRERGVTIAAAVLYALNGALRFSSGGSLTHPLAELDWGEFTNAASWLLMVPIVLQPWLAVRRQLKLLRKTGELPEPRRAKKGAYLWGCVRPALFVALVTVLIAMAATHSSFADVDYMEGEDAERLIYLDAAALGGEEQVEPVFAAIRRGPFVRWYNYVSADGVEKGHDIITDYYDLRGQWLAKEVVARELERWEFTALEDPRADELYVMQRGNRMELQQLQVVARRGERVVAVRAVTDPWEESPDLTACLDEICALIQQ